MVDKISPNDPRIERKTTKLNGITYSYMLAEPQGTPSNTIFLIHGFPDIGFAWRYQIPLLTSLRLRVVVPDMMGYAGTDAPEGLHFYTYKRAADDMASLAHQLGVSSIILGGHDWGGAIVFRIALWYPHLVSAIFSICTPFWVPRTKFLSNTRLPNFKYQFQLKGTELESEIVGEEKIRQFLNGMYGGKTPEGEYTFAIDHGCYFDRLGKVGLSPLLSVEEMDYYVASFARNGFHPPLNWYRTEELNFEDETDLSAKIEKDGFKFSMPVLFVAGAHDDALPPSMSKGMDKYFEHLTREEVQAGHWILWEQPEETNGHIKAFIERLEAPKKANL